MNRELIITQIAKVLKRLLNNDVYLMSDPDQWELILLTNDARREWQWSKKIINELKDWDLIDQAIYTQEAAERKYVHLLRQVRKQGIKANDDLLMYLILSAHNPV